LTLYKSFPIGSLWKFKDCDCVALVIDHVPDAQGFDYGATFFYLMKDLVTWNTQTYSIESIFEFIERIC
jgi:hypothetical protein